MPTISTEVNPNVKEWIAERAEMLDTAQKNLIESMIIYCIKDSDSVLAWQEWYVTENPDNWENPFEQDPDEEIDFISGLGDDLPSDDPEHREVVMEAREDTESDLDELLDSIDSLGE